MRLGLFDSGVGGLSVVNALLNHTPDLHAVYVADTAFMPYGDKPKAVLWGRVSAIVKWLTPQVDAIVVACNTSAALFANDWQTVTPLPVFDPISATAAAFKAMAVAEKNAEAKNAANPNDTAAISGLNHIGVMATPNTVASLAYPVALTQALRQTLPHIQVSQVACPGLATAIELNQLADIKPQLNDWLATLTTATTIATSTSPTANHIVLGCTHYPLALPFLQAHYAQQGVNWFNPADALASQLPPFGAGLGTALPQVNLFTTGNVDAFSQQLRQLPLHQGLLNSAVAALTLV
jgi:glutamate racemase